MCSNTRRNICPDNLVILPDLTFFVFLVSAQNKSINTTDANVEEEKQEVVEPDNFEHASLPDSQESEESTNSSWSVNMLDVRHRHDDDEDGSAFMAASNKLIKWVERMKPVVEEDLFNASS